MTLVSDYRDSGKFPKFPVLEGPVCDYRDSGKFPKFPILEGPVQSLAKCVVVYFVISHQQMVILLSTLTSNDYQEQNIIHLYLFFSETDLNYMRYYCELLNSHTHACICISEYERVERLLIQVHASCVNQNAIKCYFLTICEKIRP